VSQKGVEEGGKQENEPQREGVVGVRIESAFPMNKMKRVEGGTSTVG